MKLHIPEQFAPSDNAPDSQPEPFNNWLVALPQADMGNRTRQIYTALCEQNQLIMSDANRYKNLEAIRKPLRDILNNLNKHYTNRALPLPEKCQTIVNLNQSLLREIAIGYKILINNLTQSKEGDLEILATAIYRAIRYQSELLLRASVVYAQSPAGTWLDLHQIYDVADNLNLTLNPIADEENHAAANTIDDIYKQILLFSLARPIALRQPDAEKLYSILPEWAKFSSISKTANINDIKRVFCIRVTADRPPSYLKQTDCEEGQLIRTFSTAVLSDYIENLISNPSKETQQSLSPETLQTLAYTWGEFAKRRFTRSTRIGHISTAIGLHSIVMAIKNEEAIQKASDPLYKENLHSSRQQLQVSLESLQETNINKTKKNASSVTTPSHLFTDPTIMAQSGDLQLHQADVDLHWEIVNVSVGGYCLRWNCDETSKAQIGELIAVREREANGTYQWRVGVIRWMQFTREHGLEIGVQLLSPKVSTAQVIADNSSLSCIMLPGINPLKLPTTLLLPSNTYQINDKLDFKTLGQLMKIQLTAIKENTATYTQFLFTQTDKTVMLHDRSRQLLSDTTDDFEQIWASL